MSKSVKKNVANQDVFPKQWDLIAVTAKTNQVSDAYVGELHRMQHRGIVHADTILVSIPDPGMVVVEGTTGNTPSLSVGSGGATLNALVVIVEHLSARAGETAIDASQLLNKRILLINMGGTTKRIPHTITPPLVKADNSLYQDEYVAQGQIVSQLEFLLQSLSISNAGHAAVGLWVCSVDAFMIGFVPDLSGVSGDVPMIGALTTLSDSSSCKEHGVYNICDETGMILSLSYRKGRGCKIDSDNIQLVCGLLYLDVEVCHILLNIASFPPFDCCTYIGIDDGGTPVSLSLYLDILAAILPDTNQAEFISKSSENSNLSSLHLKILWNELHGRAKVVPLELIRDDNIGDDHQQTRYIYVHNPNDYRLLHVEPPLGYHLHTMCTARKYTIHNSSAVVNSLGCGSGSIGSMALVEHSLLKGDWKIGNGSICSCVQMFGQDLVVRDFCMVQEIRLYGGKFITMLVLGLEDNLADENENTATFMLQSLDALIRRAQLSRSNVFDSSLLESKTQPSLYYAKLFPLFELDYIKPMLGENSQRYSPPLSLQYLLRGLAMMEPFADIAFEAKAKEEWLNSRRVSLHEIIQNIDMRSEIEWKKQISFLIDDQYVRSTLITRQSKCLRNIYSRMAQERRWELLDLLDSIVSDDRTPQDVAARTLAQIGDFLSIMSPRDRGGLRSGPANNREFQPALREIEGGDIRRGVGLLKEVRAKWVRREETNSNKQWSGYIPYSASESLVRAARHYEGAAALLVRRAVASCKQFVHLRHCDKGLPDVNKWFLVTSPVRIDVAGGWTDTPPITFECGGIVTNMAIEIDGKRPIGCKLRRIPEAILILRIRGYQEVKCTHLAEMCDYNKPSAPAALLKAAVLCTELVSLNGSSAFSKLSLAGQLEKSFGGGVEIESFSDLPMGSGLGTSSILAACLLEGIARAGGRTYDPESLTHAVLLVEQMLTTGGGWQDQVGGVYPGIKISQSSDILPLKVVTNQLSIPSAFIEVLNKHIVLLFTGRARLARNLLNIVVRRWYARLPEIVETINDLKRNAIAAAEAFEKGDIEAVGKCLRLYWEHKKKMAKGCEPSFVADIFSVLRKKGLVYGESLAGAGGGGFMVLITTRPNCEEEVKEALHVSPIVNESNLQFYSVCVDTKGIDVEYD